MTDLFSPKRPDGRAEWRVVHDEAVKLAYGALLTYGDIAGLLDTGDRNRAHRAVGRCNRQFVQENRPRVLGNVRGEGYRVLQPGEYADTAIGLQKQARKKMSTAVDLMRAAPLADMTAAQRDWAHRVTMVLVDNELRLRSQEQWQKDAERRLSELENRVGVPTDVLDIEPEA